jgi:hypothetical protein
MLVVALPRQYWWWRDFVESGVNRSVTSHLRRVADARFESPGRRAVEQAAGPSLCVWSRRGSTRLGVSIHTSSLCARVGLLAVPGCRVVSAE